jgi:tetratricopeptide (TPR) repeat protein
MQILLAQMYNSKKETDRAIAVLDRLLQRAPDNYGAYSARANFHFQAKEYDAVIGDANEMIRLKPDAADGFSHRATAYTLKRDFDRAIADLTQAIRLNPDDDRSSYFMRGSLYNRKGDYERAVSDASQVIKIALAHIAEGAARSDRFQQVYSLQVRSAYSERSLYRTNMGDFEKALADCNEIISRWPENSEGYKARGQFYYWQKQYDLAIPDYDKALQLEPGESTSRSGKALALLHLGRIGEASAEVEAGLRSGTDRDRFLGARGVIAYEQGKFAQAIDDLSEAARLSAFEFPAYYLYRGQAFEKLGQKALAMADYKTAAGLDATNPAQRDARILARERLAVLQGETLTAQQVAQPQQHLIDLGRRIALVIGVSAYEKADRLPNPVNDADAVANALRGLGFADVTEVRDPDRATLEKSIQAFGDKVEKADWAMVFYAGHGMQMNGHTFLIPRDAEISNERHVEFETVSLDRVVDSVAGAKKLALVIVDACRNNPFLSRMIHTGRSVRALGQGLAAIEPQQGQFVVYATKDGSTAEDGAGDHSPFTQALLMHIGEAGLDIRLMFSKVRDSVLNITQNRQNPFTYGSLPGEGLYFKMAER